MPDPGLTVRAPRTPSLGHRTAMHARESGLPKYGPHGREAWPRPRPLLFRYKPGGSGLARQVLRVKATRPHLSDRDCAIGYAPATSIAQLRTLPTAARSAPEAPAAPGGADAP